MRGSGLAGLRRRVRVVIAEDLLLLREGLSRLLTELDCTVVSAVDSPEALLDSLDRERPDVAVVDIRLPPTYRDEGLRAAIEARRRRPGTPILILSQYMEHTYVRSPGVPSVGDPAARSGPSVVLSNA